MRVLRCYNSTAEQDHFVLLEVWQDQAVFENHGKATHTTQLREKLQPLRVSPYDERLHKGLAIRARASTGAAGATYVVTHADTVPRPRTRLWHC